MQLCHRRRCTLKRVINIIGIKYAQRTFKAFVQWKTQAAHHRYHTGAESMHVRLEEAAAQTMLLDHRE